MISKNEKKPERVKLLLRAFIRLIILFPLLGLILFLPAGTFEYWNALVYLITLIYLLTEMRGHVWNEIWKKTRISFTR